jgi:glyoxylase-like metal-dependent hydrolase (beta-lactamase superfamily II)
MLQRMLNFAKRPRRASAITGLAIGLTAMTTLGAKRFAPPMYDVYAIRYATVPNYKASGLIEGADTSRRLDLAMTVWLLKGPDGRNVLVDAGFYRDNFIRSWKPVNFVLPSEAVVRAGVKPEDVTDIIISHVHWDHLDGVDLFPKARVWIQREELEHHTDSAGTVKDRAISPADAKVLADLAKQGRVMLVDGDAKEIIPGIRVYIGGKHTFASQFATVNTASGTVVVASDNMYLYENMTKHVPIAQTLDKESNLRAQDRMKTLASNPRLIIPGHDPEVFVRFPEPGNGIAHIH